jgi:3-phosphoinositide dependent protein kinase-1
LIVTVSPQQASALRNGNGVSDSSNPQEQSRKFSRFFMHGTTTKRRQRLVMVTSSARLILAASGGDEKKAKLDVSLLSPGVTWKSWKDQKGLTNWCIDTVSFSFSPQII